MGRKKIISYPNDAKKIAKIDEFLCWQHNSLLASTGKIFYDSWIKPFNPSFLMPPHGMMINVGKPSNFVALNQSLSDIESVWLKDQKFLASNEATFADLMAACAIMQIVELKLYKLDGKRYPKLIKWLEDVKEEFNPEFDEAHKIVYKMGEKFGGKPPTMAILLFKVYDRFKKLLR